VLTPVEVTSVRKRFIETAGVASVPLASLLRGPTRPARVIGAFPAAIYLDAGDLVVAVVTLDAVRLANAVVIPMRSTEGPFSQVWGGTAAKIGEGSVTVGSLCVRANRWWDPQVGVGAVDPSTVRTQLARLGSLLAGDDRQPGVALPAGLVDAWRACDLPVVVSYAGALVGLGPGLTPSGDDLLSGMLAAFRALGGDAAFADAAAMALAALAAARTTSISATLLRLAGAGQVAQEAADVVRAIASGEALEPAVHTLLGVGHTSGADVAAGILAGAVAARGMATAAAVPPRVRIG
jgi:hypothetical protein